MMSKFEIIYAQFKSPMRSRVKSKNSMITNIFSGILQAILPKANPDFDKIVEDVNIWLVEYNLKNECVNREIGIDENNEVIIVAPYDNKNLGYWVDNWVRRSDFNKLMPMQISKSELKKNGIDKLNFILGNK